MSQELNFSALVEHTLAAIEDALDASAVEVDTRRSGPVLTLEFEDDSKIVINGQEAVRELWVACRAGGFHFRREGSIWQDTRGAGELFSCLSRWVSAQSGQAVVLANR
jgi:CyaY protein